MRIGEWYTSYMGRRIYVMDPRPEDVCIEDIAHSLSLICRFNGHCVRHYTVGEHSLLMTRNASPELALACLLHDAPEAYIQDIVRPFKKYLGDKYKILERVWERVIGEALGVVIQDDPEVKLLDERALATERRDLVPQFRPDPGRVYEPFDEQLPRDAPSPLVIERVFLGCYRELRG